MRWFTRKPLWVPTGRLWLVLIALTVAACGTVVFTLHPFLAVNRPVPANVLVIEGWVADYVIEAAAAEFRTNRYDYLVCSGGPLPKGYLVSGYATYADLAADTARKLDVPKGKILVAPAEHTFRRRTLTSARGVRALLEQRDIRPSGVNVVTQGPHARRTWRTYRAVLDPAIPVGVLSYPPQDYDPKRWWASSEGAKNTLGEAVGWVFDWTGEPE